MSTKKVVTASPEADVVTEPKYDIEGLSKDAAMTKLISEFKLSFGVATKYWKDNGSKSNGGVFQATLDWLELAPRTESELADFILAEGTANEARWFGQRDTIRKLSVNVAIKYGAEFTEVERTTAQKEALKKAFAK